MIVEVETLWGTRTTSSCAETDLKTAPVAPKRTADASSRFLPVISTRDPSGPLVGETRRISGRSVWANGESKGTQTNAAIAMRFTIFVPKWLMHGRDARAYMIIDYLTGYSLNLPENRPRLE